MAAASGKGYDRDPDINVAVIFGVTGLVGKELARKLVTKSNWKTYGVARNPDHHRTQVPIHSPNFTFISCDLLDPLQAVQKLSPLHQVTHIFWVTWASRFQLDTQECCDENKTMFSNALNAILPVAKNLKHVSLQTGTKHYVSLVKIDSDINHDHEETFSSSSSLLSWSSWSSSSSSSSSTSITSCYYTEESPRTAVECNFYYVLEDLLKERLAGKVAWSVHRPGLILGSSDRTVFNVVGCLGVYGTMCKHLKLPFLFGGSRECWEEPYIDGSDAMLVAEQHIWSSTNHDLSSNSTDDGQAFNAVNGSSFTWKEVWPALVVKFGLDFHREEEEEYDDDDKMFSSSFKFADFMADKGGIWEEIVEKEGLCRTRMDDLANWVFLDTLFRCPFKILVNRDKVNRLGFTMTCDTVKSILYWVDCMRQERFIP